MLPNMNMISNSFYSHSAFRYGDWYGHMSLFPVHDDMKNRADEVKSSDSREAFRDWLWECFAQQGAEYEFKVGHSHIYCCCFTWPFAKPANARRATALNLALPPHPAQPFLYFPSAYGSPWQRISTLACRVRCHDNTVINSL
jgi:hypothetical protein